MNQNTDKSDSRTINERKSRKEAKESMMRKMDKILKKWMLAGYFAVLVIAGILMAPASRMDVRANVSDESKEYGNFKYEIIKRYDGDTTRDYVEITRYTESEGVTEVTVPEEIEGYKVKEIRWNAFEDCSSLTKVILPTTVTSIGDDAFKGCTNLKSITMEGVIDIGESAFENCINLEQINFSTNIWDIGENAFKGTAWLKAQQESSPFIIVNGILISVSTTDESIEIPEGVTELTTSALSECESVVRIRLPKSLSGKSSLNFSLSKNLKNLKEITVDEQNPNYSAENGILYDKGKMRVIGCPVKLSGAVHLPDTVNSIGEYAFENCTDLTSIEIPETVTSIERGAFWRCSSLTSIEIPESVTGIEGWTFGNCSSLTSIEIPESVTSIGEDAFTGCSSLTSITIPASVTSIGSGVFSGCSSLTSIEIPESVTSIGEDAFSSCSSLASIEIPASVTSIEEGTFNACSSLTSITVPDSVTSIGEYAFSECSSLRSITIPASVISMGEYAFNICSSLRSITIPASVTSIGENVFIGCSSLRSITIPASVTSIEAGAFSGCSSLTSITIPDSVTSIEVGAFSYCSSLTSITIPNSVTSIGEGAFRNCSSLANITLPKSLTNIGDYAFESCSSLANVTFLNPSTEYSDSAFEGTPWLANGKKNQTSTNEPKPDQDAAKDTTQTPDDTQKAAPVALAAVKVSLESITYTGKAQKPAVTVTDTNGQTVDVSGYTVTYANNKNVGQATVTVTGTGNYTGTLSGEFLILPKGTSLSKVTAKKKGLLAKWKKQTTQTNGYQLQYAANPALKKAKSVTIKGNKATSVTIKKLKAKKKYYVRVRTFKTVKINGKSTKLYSGWSKVKGVKVK